eukprot:COSAG06_NODE_2777_length_6300_cov_38.831963_1_plen_84_part_00
MRHPNSSSVKITDMLSAIAIIYTGELRPIYATAAATDLHDRSCDRFTRPQLRPSCCLLLVASSLAGDQDRLWTSLPRQARDII